MKSELILISHPNRQWHGAHDLRTASDGFLLAVTRNPIRDGASRLLEEGFDPSTTMVIRDSYDAAPEIRTTIKEALKA